VRAEAATAKAGREVGVVTARGRHQEAADWQAMSRHDHAMTARRREVRQMTPIGEPTRPDVSAEIAGA
jgi:hypothetical protein